MNAYENEYAAAVEAVRNERRRRERAAGELFAEFMNAQFEEMDRRSAELGADLPAELAAATGANGAASGDGDVADGVYLGFVKGGAA